MKLLQKVVHYVFWNTAYQQPVKLVCGIYSLPNVSWLSAFLMQAGLPEFLISSSWITVQRCQIWWRRLSVQGEQIFTYAKDMHNCINLHRYNAWRRSVMHCAFIYVNKYGTNGNKRKRKEQDGKREKEMNGGKDRKRREWNYTLVLFWFLPRCMKCRRGLAMRILSVCLSVRLSVCLSVRPSHAWIVTKR